MALAVRIRGQVLVAVLPLEEVVYRIPKRYADELTTPISIVARSEIPDATARMLIRAIDNGEPFEVGTSNEDSSGYVTTAILNDPDVTGIPVIPPDVSTLPGLPDAFRIDGGSY